MCVLSSRDECKKIITEAAALGFTESISEGKLVNIIMTKRGVIDERAIRNWTRALIAFGFIEEKAPHVYTITTT